MGTRIITKRYAEAFVYYAKRTIGINRCIEEVKALKKIITDNPEFMSLLLSPETTLSEKFEFIDTVLKDIFSQELVQLVKLVAEKRRAPFLIDMLDYIRINYSHGEAVDALLKSANILDLEIVREIKEKLENKLQKKLHFYLELDASLIGGVQVTVGNTVIDGSVKRRLEELREKIKSARVVEDGYKA